MKNLSFVPLLLLMSLSLFLFYGCGQTHSTPTPTPTVTPTPAATLYIVNWYPTTGETSVSSTTAISVTFSNPISLETFSLSFLEDAVDDRAGDATGSITWEWSADYKTITIEGITGWTGMAITTEAPVRVHKVATSGLKDIYGHGLAAGTTVAKYDLAIEFWRYYPATPSFSTIYWINEEGQHPLMLVPSIGSTETRTVSTETVEGFGYIQVWGKDTEGSEEEDDPIYVKSNNLEIWRADYKGAPPLPLSGYNGFKILENPVTDSTHIDAVNCEYEPGQFLILSGEVTNYATKQFISTPLGAYTAYKVDINTYRESSEWELYSAETIWLVYNMGVVKICYYEDESRQTINTTYEAIYCTIK